MQANCRVLSLQAKYEQCKDNTALICLVSMWVRTISSQDIKTLDIVKQGYISIKKKFFKGFHSVVKTLGRKTKQWRQVKKVGEEILPDKF